MCFHRLRLVHRARSKLEPVLLNLVPKLLARNSPAINVANEILPFVARHSVTCCDYGSPVRVFAVLRRLREAKCPIREIGELGLRENLFVQSVGFFAGNDSYLELGSFVGERLSRS